MVSERFLYIDSLCRQMIRSPFILFMPESTEGVDVGQVTALDYENEANRTEKWKKRDEHWAD